MKTRAPTHRPLFRATAASAAAAAAVAVAALATSGCPAALQPPRSYDPELLREAEGCAALELAILEADREARESASEDPGPCAPPTLESRMQSDGNFIRAADAQTAAIDVRVDVLLPALSLPADELCPERALPAVGFELLTEEAGDDEEHSGDPYGLTHAEERALQTLRERGEAMIAILRPEDYPVVVHFRDSAVIDDDDGPSSPSMEERDVEDAQRRLREAVRAILATLRREGRL
ncbi:MAG: hypothetical protein JXB32_13980 [Deltaproteobacteria bacterium]|nr:hypothetical protein [Deltaproteobacteria bacterium]